MKGDTTILEFFRAVMLSIGFILGVFLLSAGGLCVLAEIDTGGDGVSSGLGLFSGIGAVAGLVGFALCYLCGKALTKAAKKSGPPPQA